MRLLDLLMLVEAGKGHVTSTKERLFVSRSVFQPMRKTVKSCNGIDVCNRLLAIDCWQQTASESIPCGQLQYSCDDKNQLTRI